MENLDFGISYPEALARAKDQGAAGKHLVPRGFGYATDTVLDIARRLEGIATADTDLIGAQTAIHHWREQAILSIHKLDILIASIQLYKEHGAPDKTRWENLGSEF